MKFLMPSKLSVFESELLLKKLIENTTDAVFIIDGSGRHLKANTRWCNFLGRSKEELLKLNVWDLIHADEKDECMTTMNAVIRGEKIPVYTRDFVKKDGSIVTGEMNIVLIDDTQDGSKSILGIVKDITQPKQETEKILKLGEKKYRHLLESIPQRIFYKAPDSSYVACNPAYAESLGIEPEDIVGKTDYDFFPKEQADFFRKTDRDILESGTTYCQDEKIVINDEEVITHIIKRTVKDDDGKIIGILGIFWDITERENAKTALEASEKQYRLLLENLTDGLYRMDTNGYITWASNTAAEIFGRDPDIVVGSHLSEYIHPDEKERVFKVMKDAIENGITNPEGFEVKAFRPDGSVFYYQVHNKVLEEEGKIIGIQGLIRDVTAFRIAQDALEASEERYRTFLENFQGIAYRATLDWIPEFIHGSVELITGYTEEEFVSGKPRWDEIIHPEDLEYFTRTGQSLISDPQCALDRKYRIIKKNGEIRWIHELSGNVCDDSGVPKWAQGSIYDITEVVLAEKTLKRSLNDLEIYASLLQHDLRNDLQVILHQAEVSLLEGDIPSEQRKYWKTVERTSHSMVRLLDVFVQPSKFYEMSITNLIKMLIADIKKIYPDLKIHSKFDKHASESIVIGSRLLPCIFDNLFRNVVEHSGKKATVTINAKIEENNAIIDFSDNGSGIDAKILPKLFQKGTSTTGGGYGLYLSRKIIEAYDGQIDVMQSDEKGTTFRIRLPSI
jgi:PAS domain S-box-containing protein